MGKERGRVGTLVDSIKTDPAPFYAIVFIQQSPLHPVIRGALIAPCLGEIRRGYQRRRRSQ